MQHRNEGCGFKFKSLGVITSVFSIYVFFLFIDVAIDCFTRFSIPHEREAKKKDSAEKNCTFNAINMFGYFIFCIKFICAYFYKITKAERAEKFVLEKYSMHV